MMRNQLQADLYRQRHTHGLIYTSLIMIVLAILVTYYRIVGGVLIAAPMSIRQHLYGTHWTVLDGIRSGFMFSTNLLYVLISVFVIVIGYEFSYGVYKNSLITGISRLQFILAKYCMILIDLLMILFLYNASIMLTGLALGRPLGESWSQLLLETTGILLTASFFMSLIFSIAILVLIVTRSVISGAVLIVVWPLLIAFAQRNTHWDWLKYGDFFTTSSDIAFGVTTGAKILPYFCASLGLLLLTTIASTLLIRKQEL